MGGLSTRLLRRSSTWHALLAATCSLIGVTALSVGLALSSVGSATFDDFALASGET